MRIKRDKLDDVFSRLIRARDRWTCQRCGAVHASNSGGLHCSHYWSRRNQGTRFDEMNCVALCYGCHMYLTGNPQSHHEFIRGRLTPRQLELLEYRARADCKRNKAERELLYKELRRRLAELQGEIRPPRSD